MSFFCKNGKWLKVINYFCKKLHLRCLTEFWIHLCILPSRNFIYTFAEVGFAREKNGRMKEWIFTKVWFDFAKQTIVFTKKSLYIIFLNKKVKWLKFLFANKGPPYLFEKFNWKFRINIWVEVIQSICEFVKSVNQ